MNSFSFTLPLLGIWLQQLEKQLIQELCARSGCHCRDWRGHGVHRLLDWFAEGMWMSLGLWDRNALEYWGRSLRGRSNGNLEERDFEREMTTQKVSAHEVSEVNKISTENFSRGHPGHIPALPDHALRT